MLVEHIPWGWIVRPLVEVATLQRGFDLPVQDRIPGNVPILAANSIVGTHNEAKVKGPGVVTGRSGSIGNVQYIDDSFWPLNTSLYVNDFHGNNPRFIYYLLREMKLNQYHEGTGVPTLNRNNVHRVFVPVPPLSEQRRIVAILDKADALRAKRREALAQLERLVESVFIDIVGDPVSNPMGWKSKKLVTLGTVTTGGTPPGGEEGMYGASIPFITPGDLGADAEAKRFLSIAGAATVKTVRAGATLVCCIGATIGKVGIAKVVSTFNQQINAVEWGEDVVDHYGYHIIKMLKPTIVSWGSSTTLPILKKSLFEKIEIPVPPTDIQHMFSRNASSILCSADICKRSLETIDELIMSLQHRAFSGRL